MIALATLLLGLIVGPQPVEFIVGSSVASVELSLDGRWVGELEGSPWTLTCDFGQRLEPHELVAVAFDSDHNEVGRTRQWINMPRQPAEATIALEEDRDGAGLIANLRWESVVDAEPVAITAFFDGKPLSVVDPHRIELPAFDPGRLHHFRAELDFSDNVNSVVETTFAGGYVDRVNTELTAIPVALDRRAELPSVQALSGRFTKDSHPLRVVAVENGPADVIIVRDETARGDLNRLHRHDREALWRRARGGRLSDRGSGQTRLPLPGDMKVRFLWPLSNRKERSGSDLEVFPPSREFTSRDGGLFWVLTYVRQPFTASRTYRYADAIAAAGLLAAGRNRRRAVVLVVGEQTMNQDASQFELAAVRRYLGDLGVPLLIWSTSSKGGPDDTRRRATDVSSLRKLGRASQTLYETLERQRIVWLEGTHLPQDIVLNDDGLPVRLVR